VGIEAFFSYSTLHSCLLTESGAADQEPSAKRTSAEWRAMWKKAMLETLLLIRMEKENSDIKGNHHFASVKFLF
jgi:hypothetical protein